MMGRGNPNQNDQSAISEERSSTVLPAGGIHPTNLRKLKSSAYPYIVFRTLEDFLLTRQDSDSRHLSGARHSLPNCPRAESR